MTNESGKAADFDGDEHADDAHTVQLWRQRSADNDVQDKPDANLILLADTTGTVESVVSQVRDSTALPDGVKRGDSLFTLWSGITADRLKHSIRKATQGRQPFNTQVWDETSAVCIEFIVIPQGPKRIMLIVRDVTDLQAEKQQLEDLAFADSATGLPNRRWLDDELNSILDRVKLRQGRCAVLCLEVDGQTNLKETHGDEGLRVILANVASRLLRNLRGANERDELDDERYSAVARIEDTKFAVVLPDIGSEDDATRVALRIAEELSAPMLIEAREIKLDIRSGTAVFPQDGERAGELIRCAIVAANEARFSHTSSHKFHTTNVGMQALERQDLLVELESALKNDEFDIHFLPVFEQPAGNITTAEVLLRWPRPLFATHPIREVIRAAEYTGIIVSIGEWVMANACRALKTWRDDGHDSLRIALNVSAREFSRDDLPDCIQQWVDATGLDTSCIELEITERLLLQDSIRGFQACNAVTDIGARVVVDDYGTGICSFDSLAASPISGVKIHQRFTAGVDHDPNSRAACSAIVAMARELGLTATAEGVETEEQATVLRELGCKSLQGFLFGEPMNGPDMTAFLVDHSEDES
ncbi:MAG: bifunctional diguanylate cyclase/phosphodiesterase [Pseudomonadota bacterium]